MQLNSWDDCWAGCEVLDFRLRIERRWRELSSDPYVTTHIMYKVVPYGAAAGTYYTPMLVNSVGDQHRSCYEWKRPDLSEWFGLRCTAWLS